MIKRFLCLSFLLAAGLALNACGGGSGNDQPATGQVAVVFTDGPTDEYERILVSITGMSLIGAGGQVALYDGPEITFDLLEMSEWGDLAFNTEVLAGSYNKIRLQLSGLELEDTDDPSNSVFIDNLPANGMIDLNPQGPFEVSPDFTTVIKLDMDAERSFQAVQTGQGKVQFRPIIFVDVFEGNIVLPERLVRVFGTVDAGSIEGAGTPDASDDAFRLCSLVFVAQSSGPDLGDPAACVKVHADAATGLFDDTGAPQGFGTVAEGDLLTAVGFLVDTDDPAAVLGLNSVALAIGDRQPSAADGWTTAGGVVATDPVACAADQCFDFDPDGADPVVTTRMQPETRVFRADGAELTQADVSTGDGGSVDGLPVGGELYAALVVLSSDAGSGLVTGTLDGVGTAGSLPVLEVMTGAGGLVNVCVNADTDIIRVLTEGEVTLLDLVDVSTLETGLLVEAFGDASAPPAGCDVLADQVIVEPAP